MRDKMPFRCGCANVGYGKVATSLVSTAALEALHPDMIIAKLPI
jgi:hypothetical protein